MNREFRLRFEYTYNMYAAGSSHSHFHTLQKNINKFVLYLFTVEKWTGSAEQNLLNFLQFRVYW